VSGCGSSGPAWSVHAAARCKAQEGEAAVMDGASGCRGGGAGCDLGRARLAVRDQSCSRVSKSHVIAAAI
jgi:hypothetical protein